MMRRIALGTLLALALAAAPVAGVLAQDAMEMAPHPSHIHAGVCPAPGDVVAALSDVAAVPGDSMGVGTAIPVEAGISTVDLALADILAADHAFVVHQSADDMGTYIACGDICGQVMESNLAVGLGPVGESGYSGIAWLVDNGDGTTGVSLFITHSGAVAMMAEG